MSLMESIHCLLLFKNYHRPQNRKRDGKHNDDDTMDVPFSHCNVLLLKKLTKLDNEKRDYVLAWPEVWV